MLKTNKKHIILSSVVILLPILFGLILWNYLPDKMATHWGADGTVDGWSGKAFSVFALPLILLVMHWISIFITSLDKKNREQSSKVFNMVLWIIPMVSILTSGTMYAIALGYAFHISSMTSLILGLMFLIIGNYMPKCKQNSTIGIKVAWTLRNEENWNKTHRFAGKLWVVGGVIILATMLIPIEKIMYGYVVVILVLAFVPMLYSYLYYRKQLQLGTATKGEAGVTSVDKRTARIGGIITVVVLSLAGIFLFTGEFQVELAEDAIRIDAAYWEDATVYYVDIDKIEYREQDTSGVRTFGYGSFSLLMGEFENEEFGPYTRYSYTSCESGIVLQVGEKILVLNDKDAESTKKLYESIKEKVQ